MDQGVCHRWAQISVWPAAMNSGWPEQAGWPVNIFLVRQPVVSHEGKGPGCLPQPGVSS